VSLAPGAGHLWGEGRSASRASAPRLCALPLAALLACVLALPARADSRVEAKVVSLRGQNVHLELTTAVPAGSERLVAGREVEVKAGEAEPFRAKLIAASSRFLVLQLPPGVELGEGPVTVAGTAARPQRREQLTPSADPPPQTAPVKVGRTAPTLGTFTKGPQPERELVPFRGGTPKAKGQGAGGSGQGGVAEGQDPEEGAKPRVDAEGNELTASGRIANQVVGEVMVGVDGFYDDDLDVNRTTPYTRLRLEVRQLGGSDRLRFRFYGSVRRPFDGTDDWTEHNSDQLNARVSFLALELDAAQSEKIKSFSDRIEFGVGRATVPGVIEAGVVDGGRFGVKAGPVTVFGFGGFASSLNPREDDYENLIYGGGIRLEQAFSHSGAIRLSVAGAQQRYESDGVRDFVESQAEIRYGLFGVRGLLVVDFFDPLRDKRDTRVTTGSIQAYAQFNKYVRLEGGYRERRPQYQKDLLEEDLFAEAIANLDKTARRNIWGGFRFTLFDAAFELWLRAEVYEGRRSREANGGVAGFSIRANQRHRFLVEFALRRRFRSDSEDTKTYDPFAIVSWLYQGESLMSQLSVAYRDSFPKSADDRRIALRLFLDYEIGGGFGLRGYGEVAFRRDHITDDDGISAFGGFAARYRF
jgi:hypothetical protein